MMNYEQFEEFYLKNGRCPNDLSKRKNPLNERELQSKYEKYLQSEDKKKAAKERYMEKAKDKPVKTDERYFEVRQEAIDFYGEGCMLIRLLDEFKETKPFMKDLSELLKRNAGHLYKTVDVAHVFSRGNHPELKYDVENLVPLNRWSHSNLDQFRHPIFGNQIGKKEHELWWRFIVGDKTYNQLKNKIAKKLSKKIQ